MAAKRPIVEQGDTPGKPKNKRQSTEGRSGKSLLQEGNIPIKSSGRRGWTDAEFACFGMMLVATNGLCSLTPSFGIVVPM